MPMIVDYGHMHEIIISWIAIASYIHTERVFESIVVKGWGYGVAAPPDFRVLHRILIFAIKYHLVS